MITPTAMFPVVVVDRLDAVKKFYIEQFGFEAVFEDSSFYVHLLHPTSGAQLGFMVENHRSQPTFLHHPPSHEGWVISLEVADVRAAHETANARSLDIVFDFKVENFGVSHFMVRDPGGNIVDVVEHHQT